MSRINVSAESYRVTIDDVRISTIPTLDGTGAHAACPICGAMVTFSASEAGAIGNVKRHAAKEHGAKWERD